MDDDANMAPGYVMRVGAAVGGRLKLATGRRELVGEPRELVEALTCASEGLKCRAR